MLNCLNIDCDTDLLVVGINIGDWTCLWFDFLNEQEWDKCNLWCSGASVINSVGITPRLHLYTSVGIILWTFDDRLSSTVGHLWLQCVCTLQGHGHIFPNEGLNYFFIMQKTYWDIFLKPCVLIKILICWVMYSIYSEHCVNGQPSLFANNKDSLVLSWTAMGWQCKPNPLVTIAWRPLRTNTFLLKIWLSIIES